jgi:creatinine amidohydrolase
MTWQEIEHIDFEKSVVFLPLSPLEEHSHHLPIGTDCFLAEKACELSANKLLEISEYQPLIFPMIPLGIAEPTRDFVGTISLPESLYTRIVENILVHLSTWGFQYCVIVTTHLDVPHLVSLHAAIRLVQHTTDLKVAEPAAQWMFGTRTNTDESPLSAIDTEYPDMHAGRWETSLMMYLYPDMVNNDVREHLPHRKISQIDWRQTWRQQGAVGGHLGTPSLATADIGKHEVWHLEACADVAVDLIKGKTSPLPQFIDEKVTDLLQRISCR